MLPNPSNIDKYIYIRKTPTWKIRTLYLLGIISWLLIVYSYVNVIGSDLFYTWFVGPILLFLTIYHLLSFGLNLFYKQFDLQKHFDTVEEYKEEPWVDIFLPVCGEDIEVLRNTWKHVSKLRYIRKRVYVLDDSKEEIEEHRMLAEAFGFTFFERPNKGEMKKAGNLKYAFERTNGEFIAIFDADFAPHRDFLLETLPHTSDPKVGIIQTPQYFDTSKYSYELSPTSYNAAFAEEPFYRFIQVTRDRFGGAICCGSNALYRRSALDAIGGPYQIDHSEDAHTGFALSDAGFKVRYIPVILAIGLCPGNYYTFFHQQHRWCTGSMSLMLSKKFWLAKISWKAKLCYMTGFMFYLHHPFVIIFPLQLYWTLFFYNDYIPLGTGLLFFPHLIFAIFYLFISPIAKLKPGYFLILIARTYAYAHAVKNAFLKKSVGWISTNAKHSSVSGAFQETTSFLTKFALINLALIILGLRNKHIHFFDLKYWSVQFWMFWNVALILILLFYQLRIIREANLRQKGKESGITTKNNKNRLLADFFGIFDSKESKYKKSLVLGYLLFILAISSILSFYQIGKLSFWNDEIYSFFASHTKFVDIFKVDSNMSLFHAIGQIWVRILPESSEGVLRILPAIFSILTIPAVFILGSTIGNFKKQSYLVGLCGAFLLAVNAYHVQYSQEYRAYSLLVFLTVLSTTFLVKLVKHHYTFPLTKNPYLKWYIIVTAASIYSHYFAMLLVMAHAITLFFLKLSDTKTWKFRDLTFIYSAITILIAPILIVALQKGAGQISWLTTPTAESLIGSLIKITGDNGINLAILILIVALIGILAGISTFASKYTLARFKFLLLFFSLLIPIAISIYVSIFNTPIFHDRYLIYIIPYLIIFASVGFQNLADFGNKNVFTKTIFTAFTVIIFLTTTLLQSEGLYKYYTEYNKEDWRSASEFLTRNCAEDKDLRLYYMIYTERDSVFYNKNLRTQISDWNSFIEAKPDSGKIASVVNKHEYQKTCLVIAHVGKDNVKTQYNIEKALSEKYPEAENYNFYGVNVKVYSHNKNLANNAEENTQ